MELHEVMAVLEPIHAIARELDDCNYGYQTLLAQVLKETGKPTEALTIAEVADAIATANHRY